MIKLLADILGYELLILLGVITIVGIIGAVCIWTIIINFLRSIRK